MNYRKTLVSILFFLLFPPAFSFAQNSLADSLIKVVQKPGIHDSVKIKLYGDIAWELLASDINQALDYANKELELATKTNRKADIAQAESDIGNIYNRKSSYDTALIHYNKALELRKALKQDVKVAGVYSNIATVYTRQSMFEEALDISFKSLKLFEQVGDEQKQCILLGNIGYLYYDLEQNKSAEVFYQKGLALARKNKLRVLEGSLLISVGGIKFDEGVVNDSIVNVSKMDSALYYFLEAEKILVANNVIYNLGVVYNNIGRIYTQKGKYDLAVSFYEKGLKNREAVEDLLGVALSYMNLATTELLRGNADKSISYLEKSARIFHSLKNYLNLKQAYGKLAEAYKVKGNYPESLKYFELYAKYKDSVYTESNAEKMAEMQTKYDTEKKDLEIAKQKAELEAREIEKKRQQTFITALIGLVILIILLGYFIYSRNKIKQKARMDKEIANQREIRSKAVIEAEEKERRRIAQDLHDGVGQILSAAKLNLSGLEDKMKLIPDNYQDPERSSLLSNALELVNDSVKEVRAVSHNMMPNTLIKLGLASAVREFITKISSVPNLKIDLQIVGMEERLDNTVETVLYRVIQEVVANIIKHAKANVISMQLIRHENELTIMIEDNGVGFDKNKVTQFEGIGLKNIISRVEFLNGQVEFDSTPGQGTTVVIEVPLV
ncbi:MAG: tetratricopeptide repeat protein [Bacteroidetes bacterium]|jgi:signal transduction histidine kinase|nr:tetratricopeptide repeat protein [Bacteroidota bacterium]